MGRWTLHDEDSYRLPEGMTRVGYDADTGQYTFQDEDGKYYQGEPNEYYGVMSPIVTSEPSTFDASRDLPIDVVESPISADGRYFVRDVVTRTPPASPSSQFGSLLRRATLPGLRGSAKRMFKRRSQSDQVNEKGETASIGGGSQERISEEEIASHKPTTGEVYYDAGIKSDDSDTHDTSPEEVDVINILLSGR